MSIVNNFSPPATEDLLAYYGPDPYDINFSLPIQDYLHLLESDRVKLVPFVPRTHAKLLTDEFEKHPEVLRWFYMRPRTLEAFLPFVELNVRRQPNTCLFAVVDKERPDAKNPHLEGSLAGFASLDAVPAHLTAEVGILVLPAFQRTYVTSHVIGLLLRVCLELPGSSPPGFGIRRVQWIAHEKNEKSVAAAKRLGFTYEGTRRWAVVTGEGTEGVANPRKGDPFETRQGRGSATLSICWDDWENGVREHIRRLMER